MSQTSEQKQTVEVLQHRIEYSFKNGYAPVELSDSTIEHLERMVKEGYREGELIESDAETEEDHRGWWNLSFD